RRRPGCLSRFAQTGLFFRAVTHDEELWIPLVDDEPVSALVAEVQQEHPEIAELVATPRRLLAFRTFAYIRVGILLGRLLVERDVQPHDAPGSVKLVRAWQTTTVSETVFGRLLGLFVLLTIVASALGLGRGPAAQTFLLIFTSIVIEALPFILVGALASAAIAVFLPQGS